MDEKAGGGLSPLAGPSGHARAQFKGEAWSEAMDTVDPGSTSRKGVVEAGAPPSVTAPSCSPPLLRAWPVLLPGQGSLASLGSFRQLGLRLAGRSELCRDLKFGLVSAHAR